MPVAFCRLGGAPGGGHDTLTKASVAASIAALLGVEFVGTVEAEDGVALSRYLVPGDTLPSLRDAQRLGIAEVGAFFGGVVPMPFVATKIITHSLFAEATRAPAGWSPSFGERVRDVVLPGCSVFHRDDARRAALVLLRHGPLRIKEAAAMGGAGQHVVADASEFENLYQRLGDVSLNRDGWVLEQNLTEVTTRSVGHVRVGPWRASYQGTQRTTRNHHGAEVYAGSDLRVVEGDLECLLGLDMDAPIRRAVEQALVYDRAAMACFPGLMASRRNYDVVQGLDGDGQWQSGVLEQSWRIGGASGAEIAALQAFAERPGTPWVCASTHEFYLTDDATACAPRGASVHFDGADARVGRMLKYAQVDEYGHA